MKKSVVTSKKCWIDIEKKMPEISGEMSSMNLLTNIAARNALEEKSWKSEKSEKINPKIVVEEKREEQRDGCHH